MLLDNGRTHVLADRGRARDARLHSLRGVPERVPGVPSDRRPCVRVGVQRSDRRHSDAAITGDGVLAVAPVRLIALWRLLRGLPGQDQYSRDPDPPSAQDRRIRECAAGRAARHEGRGGGVLRPDDDGRCAQNRARRVSMVRTRRPAARPPRAAGGVAENKGHACHAEGVVSRVVAKTIGNSPAAAAPSESSSRGRPRAGVGPRAQLIKDDASTFLNARGAPPPRALRRIRGGPAFGRLCLAALSRTANYTYVCPH